MINLHNGDCLEVLKGIKQSSVDVVIADLPYGITKNEWDRPLPLDILWPLLLSVCKVDARILFFCSQPFTSHLLVSNEKMFREELIWDKVAPTGYLNANRRHLRVHETILLFSPTGYTQYTPQKRIGRPYTAASKGARRRYAGYSKTRDEQHRNIDETGLRYPTTIITVSNADRKGKKQETEKPLGIVEYLLRTYAKQGDHILDPTMGRGGVGVMCKRMGLDFTGIEIGEDVFRSAKLRIDHSPPLLLKW